MLADIGQHETRAGMRRADQAIDDNIGRQVQLRGLAMGIVTPAQPDAIGPDRAAEGIAGRHLHEGACGRRGLTVDVVAPAIQLAVLADRASVVVAHAEGAEFIRREWRIVVLAEVVVAPALDAAVSPQAALVEQAGFQALPEARHDRRQVRVRVALAGTVGMHSAEHVVTTGCVIRGDVADVVAQHGVSAAPEFRFRIARAIPADVRHVAPQCTDRPAVAGCQLPPQAGLK